MRVIEGLKLVFQIFVELVPFLFIRTDVCKYFPKRPLISCGELMIYAMMPFTSSNRLHICFVGFQCNRRLGADGRWVSLLWFGANACLTGAYLFQDAEPSSSYQVYLTVAIFPWILYFPYTRTLNLFFPFHPSFLANLKPNRLIFSKFFLMRLYVYRYIWGSIEKMWSTSWFSIDSRLILFSYWNTGTPIWCRIGTHARKLIGNLLSFF